MPINDWKKQQRAIREKLEKQRPLRKQLEALNAQLPNNVFEFGINFYSALERLSNEENPETFSESALISIAFFLNGSPLPLKLNTPESEFFYSELRNAHYELCDVMFQYSFKIQQKTENLEYAICAQLWLEANVQLKTEKELIHNALTETISRQKIEIINTFPVPENKSQLIYDDEEISHFVLSESEAKEIQKEMELNEEQEAIKKRKEQQKKKKHNKSPPPENSGEENNSIEKKFTKGKKEKDLSKQRDVKIAEDQQQKNEERKKNENSFKSTLRLIKKRKKTNRQPQKKSNAPTVPPNSHKGNSAHVIFRELSFRRGTFSGLSLREELKQENPILKWLYDDSNLTDVDLKNALSEIQPFFGKTEKDILIEKLKALQSAFDTIINSFPNNNSEKKRYSKPQKQPFWQTYNLDLSETQLHHIHMLKKAALSISLELVTTHRCSSKEIINHANSLIKFNRTLIKFFVKKEDNLFFKKTTTEKEIHKAAKRLIPSG